jgi:PAS domain S-box-containing protein
MSHAIKVREESIITNEQRFRDLVNSIDGIVWEMEYPSFRFLFVSKQAESLLGYPVHDWYEDHAFWGKKMHVDDVEQARAYCQLMSEKHQDHDFEYRMIAADGRIVWIRDLVTVVVKENRPVRLLGVMIDITDSKAAENELLKYRAHLEELVKERTAQLEAAQEELMQKGRLAVLGQLTATVSHEIRNPLGTVANALYFLKDSLSDEEHAHLARPLLLAERNVERCDNIISDLLDFSRQRKIQKEPLVVDGWLAELLDELSFPEEVKCCWSLASQATILADSERLRRVMVNVITNALQALNETSNADKTLEIRTRINGSRCEINVHDNGPGMSEEIMARIFEPMFSTKNFGVGLGVPIIKNILEGHGGGVEYFSEPGKGTTVAMWLPLESQSKG